MVTIFGSGFGLYGYLPALIDRCQKKIILLERYQSRLLNRPELERFNNDIQWAANDSVVLDNADTVVFALRPGDQKQMVTKSLLYKNIKYLLLEKPLAPSPSESKTLFKELLNSRKVFRIGYVFRNTEWAQNLFRILDKDLDKNNEDSRLTIHWSFMAHHFKHKLENWKRFTDLGGGAIRFYGIHIIALLAELGYRNVTSSKAVGPTENQVEVWKSTLTGPCLPDCDVVVDTNSTVNIFQVKQSFKTNLNSNVVFADLKDPFEFVRNNSDQDMFDPRVPILEKLCRSLWLETTNEYDWYEATLSLWSSVEDCLTRE
jgi:predicted dehydrogenase